MKPQQRKRPQGEQMKLQQQKRPRREQQTKLQQQKRPQREQQKRLQGERYRLRCWCCCPRIGCCSLHHRR